MSPSPTHRGASAIRSPTPIRGSVLNGILAGLVLILCGIFAWGTVSTEPIPRGGVLSLAASLTTIALFALGISLHTTRKFRALEQAAKNHHEALNITLPQLTALWENAPLSIMLFDPNDPGIPVKIVDCNPMACEIHGYAREELLGQCVDIIEHTPWTANAANWIKDLRHHRRLEGEGVHRRKDGTTFHIEFFTSLIVINGRELVIGMDRDATDRIEAENALMHERNVTRALLDNIPDHVYCKDRASRFLVVSRALALKFGLDDPAKAIGKTDFDFFKEEHARQAFADEQRIIETGQAAA